VCKVKINFEEIKFIKSPDPVFMHSPPLFPLSAEAKRGKHKAV
jgi:hypothetical protein